MTESDKARLIQLEHENDLEASSNAKAVTINEDEPKVHNVKLSVLLAGESTVSNRSSFLFKLYVVGSMVFLWTGYTIMVGYLISLFLAMSLIQMC